MLRTIRKTSEAAYGSSAKFAYIVASHNEPDQFDSLSD